MSCPLTEYARVLRNLALVIIVQRIQTFTKTIIESLNIWTSKQNDTTTYCWHELRTYINTKPVEQKYQLTLTLNVAVNADNAENTVQTIHQVVH